MTRKQRRLTLILGLGGVVAAAVTMIAIAFSSTFSFFLTPSEIPGHPVEDGRTFRLGGLVEAGSCDRNGQTLRFVVTDGAGTIPVTFSGLVPDLFREGQGVITDGRIVNGEFLAATILAKHDENYIPAEIVDELKERGEWVEGGRPVPAGTPNPCKIGYSGA
jgi:cytochrome c-type biogenesis protein CcmE